MLCHALAEHDAESLLPTRRSSRITQRAHTSEPLQGVPTHLPPGAYMASQALVLPPMSLPSASAAHACNIQPLSSHTCTVEGS